MLTTPVANIFIFLWEFEVRLLKPSFENHIEKDMAIANGVHQKGNTPEFMSDDCSDGAGRDTGVWTGGWGGNMVINLGDSWGGEAK